MEIGLVFGRILGLTNALKWLNRARWSESMGGEGQVVVIEALLTLMSRVLEGIQSLPWGVHALVALGMAAGLVLWLIGQRVLKPLVVTLVVLAGGTIGGLLVPSTSWGASLTPWHGIGLGIVAGLLIGLLLYRSAMALGFGVVLGLLLPLGAAAILEAYPLAAPNRSVPAAKGGWVETERLAKGLGTRSGAHEAEFAILSAAWQDKAATVEKDAEAIVEKMPENLKPAAERIGEFWSGLTSKVGESWRGLPGTHQAILALCGAIGLATGIITGLMLPGWASATVTSMFGAAVWLPCFVWLSNAMGAPWMARLDRSAMQWLGIWGAASVVGLIVQWYFGRRSGKGKQSAAARVSAAA